MHKRTAYLDGSFELEQDGLVDEDLPCLRTQVLDLVLLQLHGLAGTVASDCGGQHRAGRANSSASAAGARKLTFEEAVDDRVEVYLRRRIRHV